VARSDRRVAKRGVVDLRHDSLTRRRVTDPRAQLGQHLLEMLLELVDDAGLLLRREIPPRDHRAEACAPLIHIALL
jgi:hypothetical protein